METTSKNSISLLSELLAKKGIENVVIMPGSRNAPLSIALNRQEGLRCHVVVDERCGAFMAMGMAQQTQKCVAVACTSGTAVLNLAPAVAEAYYQQIPLLIITADRPEYWIDQADSQTIRQNNIYANYIKKSFCLPQEIANNTDHWYANRMVNEAIDICTEGTQGPVHINVPIDNPLYEISAQPERAEVICCATTQRCLSKEQATNVAKDLNGKNIVWIWGFAKRNEKGNAVLETLAETKNMVVLAESLSNRHGKHINNNVEAFFADQRRKKEKNDIDILMVSGGAIVSKSCKLYLRENPPKEVWYVGEEETTIDTFMSLKKRFRISADEMAKELSEQDFACNKSFATTTKTTCDQLCSKTSETSDEDIIFDTIFSNIPEESILQLSNGTTVRNALGRKNEKRLEMYCNRGTSGIDGSTSTAVGCALTTSKPVTLLTGDLSFLYDSNALWNNDMPGNLKIIVLNNHGGGIFKKLKGPSDVVEFEKYFVTPQNVNIEKLVTAYGHKYTKATNKKELDDILGKLYETDKCHVIEVEI